MPETNGGTRRSDPPSDPTRLTTEALTREILSVRELVEAAIAARAEIEYERSLRVAQQFDLVEKQRIEQKQDCVEVSTPVLCADLIWRPAGSLCVGDELITVDDEPQCSPGTRTPRRFRRALVIANPLSDDELLCVSTSYGDVLCNAHHPFLVLRPLPSGRKRYWKWIEAQDLRDGDLLHRTVDMWEVDSTWEGGWLAGIIDGEGCLGISRSHTRLSITQRDSDTATHIEQALKARVIHVAVTNKKIEPHRHTPCRDYAVNYRPEIMAILGSVRPPRMMSRADEVWENQSIGSRHRATPVLAVEQAGKGTIANLSTSTGTYIAGGFAVHNTKAAVDAALIAQKEAVREQTIASEKSVEKSERSTNESIRQQRETFSSDISILRGEIAEVKLSLAALTNQKLGAKEDRTGLYAAIAAFAGLFGIVSLVVAFVAK